MSTTHAAATILKDLEALLESTPQGGLELCLIEQLGEQVRQILRMLRDEQPVWLDTDRARQLLGIEEERYVRLWVDYGLLRGRTMDDGRVQVRLDDVLDRRYETEVSMAVGGAEMTQAELEDLSRSRPGTYPWHREQPSPPK